MVCYGLQHLTTGGLKMSSCKRDNNPIYYNTSMLSTWVSNNRPLLNQHGHYYLSLNLFLAILCALKSQPLNKMSIFRRLIWSDFLHWWVKYFGPFITFIFYYQKYFYDKKIRCDKVRPIKEMLYFFYNFS